LKLGPFLLFVVSLMILLLYLCSIAYANVLTHNDAAIEKIKQAASLQVQVPFFLLFPVN
jgi:hypothetical protein